MSAKAANKGKGRGRPKKNAPEQQAKHQPAQKTQGKDLLFILDIGTRSVIGVAGRLEDEMLRVLCVESSEHSERAVVDGQIEDIEQTARIAGQVKSRMEKTLGLTLTEVHVAAAGRVLKTEHVVSRMELDDQRPIGANAHSTVGTASDAAPLVCLLFSRVGKPSAGGSMAYSFNHPHGMWCPDYPGLEKGWS